MKIYSGKCCMGICGTTTDLVDVKGNKLCVGDQVVVITSDINSYSYVYGIHVVCDNYLVNDGLPKKDFIMGLGGVDCKKPMPVVDCAPNETWDVWMLKSWRDCVHGENIPGNACITYIDDEEKKGE